MVELINALPALLTYFVPGYMFLWVKSKINDERKKDNIELFFLAIMVTFILYFIASWIENSMIKDDSHIIVIEGITGVSIIAVFLAIIGGIVVGLFSQSNFTTKTKEKLNIKSTLYSSIWNIATSSPAWVTVYIDDLNVAYVGKLAYATCDPNIDERELYLKNYKVYDTLKGKPISEHNNDCDGVLIDCKNIVRIEFQHDKVGGI